MGIILISSRKIIIDESDREQIVAAGRWYWEKTTGYVVLRFREGGKHKKIYLHRFLLKPPSDKVVDHINRNTKDNRRENLRVVDKKANSRNSKLQTNSTSGYKGVSWSKSKKKWRAYISVNRKQLYLGFYSSKELAAAAYNGAAKALNFGICYLNKIKS